MSTLRLFAVARKELRHIVRDGRILFLVTVAPAFLLITFSYVFALDVGRVNVAVRDLDKTPASRALIAYLTAGGDFSLVAEIQREAEIRPLFFRERADAVLTIPPGFAERLQQGESVTVQCVLDGSDAIISGETLDLLEGRMAAFSARFDAPAPGIGFEVSYRAWYNGDLKSLISMVPGMLAIILCMPAMALALALTREKETGSFENLISTPVRGVEYLMGKLLAYVGSGMVGVFLSWLVATVWFRVPFRGSFPGFLLLTVDYMFASMGFSLLVSGVVRNQQTAMFLILTVFFVPSFFIAGLILPISDEPLARWAAFALPATHFITVCRGIFLKGLGPLALWRPGMNLFGLGVAAQAISLRLFDKKLV